MRRTAALLLAILVLAGCTSATAASGSPASTASAPPAATTFSSIGAGLQGPSGLTATMYATGLDHVSAFDPEGRLWAATAAYTDDGTDAVYLIAAGGARPVGAIAAQHTPLGLVWAGDTLFVASSGHVDAYSGFADGTFAHHATVLTLPGGVGEVNGLVMARDGRLVLGVSAPCDACTPATEDAAAILTFRPDGTDLRVVASGIRAPVGLTYYPGTDDLFVTMNQRDDLADATPGDWLSVVRSGQAWGFPACYGQGGSVCAGMPSPVAVLDKHAAVSGVAIVTGGLGTSLSPSALVAEWATGRRRQLASTMRTGSPSLGPHSPDARSRRGRIYRRSSYRLKPAVHRCPCSRGPVQMELTVAKGGVRDLADRSRARAGPHGRRSSPRTSGR